MSETAFIHAHLIDGTGHDPIDDATVIVRDGRITSIAAHGDPGGHLEVIDLHGMTLMPGMIDCHVHYFANGWDLAEQLMTPPSLTVLNAIPRLKTTLDAGFTLTRDAGGSPAALREAVKRGIIAGPRLQMAITILSQTGGHADKTMPCTCSLQYVMPDIPPSVVDGVEPMRKRVREILRAGADWIKVCATGGVLSATDSPSSTQFTEDELRAAVEEGRAHGHVEVMAHAQGTNGIKNAIRAGVKSIEHGIWLDDEAIAMMKAHDVYLVPTLIAPAWVLRWAEQKPGSMPDYAVQKSRQVILDHQASFRRAVAAGVRVAMGTDTGVGPHGSNAEELAMMVEHGMTPMEAIVATTRNAATLLKVINETGTIEPDKLADLIVVAGDPLADLAVLQPAANIKLVMQAGQIVKNILLPNSVTA